MTPEQMIEIGLVAFTTIFATMGPIDVAALFAVLTKDSPAPERRRLAFRGVLIAAIILLTFALFGEAALSRLGITLSAMRTAGGILLLLIGINMVFARQSGSDHTTDDEYNEAKTKEDISVFPLATPLIAGPGTMGAVVLLTAESGGDWIHWGITVGALIANLVLTLVLLMMAGQVQRVLGVTGLNVIARVIGVLLSALAVQFIFDGLAASPLLG